MSLRNLNNPTLQNYPKIQIDRSSVIKPCIAEHTSTNDAFVNGIDSGWKRVLHDLWHDGLPYILKCMTNLKVSRNSNIYYSYLIKVLNYMGLIMLHIHRVYLYIYGYFYPFSLMSLDEVCNEFSSCPKWTDSIIRAFAWHPNHDRCAISACNDYIFIYNGASQIRVLRHNMQRKIVDMAWMPNDKDILVVATQTNLIIWRIPESHNNGFLGFKDSLKGAKGVNGFNTTGLNFLQPSQLKDIRSNGNSKTESVLNNSVTSTKIPANPNGSGGCFGNGSRNMKILERLLPAPIVSIDFSENGAKLFACSPNSSKILILNIQELMNDPLCDRIDRHITYVRKFGQGLTKLLWSPKKDRLACATTSSFFRVFEPLSWTCSKWTSSNGFIQDFVWSKPAGRMLLIANKKEPFLYALPFLDESQPGDVGGNKSLMKALDVSETRTDSGESVGGLIQSLAWDVNGKRLAISFKDNPEFIILYRTVEKPTVEFEQMGVLRSDNGSTPLLMKFHDKYANGSLLTVCWSDGNCQHIPFNYSAQEQARGTSTVRDDNFDSSYEKCKRTINQMNSTPKTPRSLTNFCHVSANNSMTSLKTGYIS